MVKLVFAIAVLLIVLFFSAAWAGYYIRSGMNRESARRRAIVASALSKPHLTKPNLK